MIGIDKNNSPVIQGVYADEMREAIRRKYANQPNEADLRTSARSEEIKNEYRVVWK